MEAKRFFETSVTAHPMTQCNLSENVILYFTSFELKELRPRNIQIFCEVYKVY
jgi:hypothetical protein